MFAQKCLVRSYTQDEFNKHGEQDETDDVLREVLRLGIVKSVDDWPHGIKFAIWKNTDLQVFEDGWLEVLDKLIAPGKLSDFKSPLSHFTTIPGCNIVDIGANTGDTPLVLAVAAKGGTVVAFEMGPPIDMLRINKRYGYVSSIIRINTWYSKEIMNQQLQLSG